MEGLLRFRHNVMNVQTISTFENIKGGINDNCKDVYFVRAVGTNATYIQDIQNLDATLLKRMNDGKGYYYRTNELPKLQKIEDTTFYAACYARWQDSNRREANTRVTENNKTLSNLLAEACRTVEELFTRDSQQVSESMVKNFMVKLFFWYDSLFMNGRFCWEERQSAKIVAANITKKQEYLFFYLVTLMGCDVLLLQSKGDIGMEEEKLELSGKFVLGDFAAIAIPEYQWYNTSQPIMQHTNQNTASQGTNSQYTSSPSAANQSTANQSAANQSTANQSAANQSAANQSAASQSAASQSTANQSSNGRIVVQIPPRQRPGRNTASQAAPRPGSPLQAPRPTVPQPSPRPAVSQSPARPIVSGASGRPASPGKSGGYEAAEKSFEELAQLASSVVLIAVHDNKGERIGSGSGIMIGRDGYILTNNHVASGGKYYSVRIEDDDQEYVTDQVIKYHSVLDLAVIRIDRRLNPLPIYKRPKELVRGQKVVAIGSPLGLFNSVSDGIISGFRKIDGVDMIQFTAPTSRGSSGGAVMNMQGEVIGISTAGIDSGQNINLAMGYECINMFINGFT